MMDAQALEGAGNAIRRALLALDRRRIGGPDNVRAAAEVAEAIRLLNANRSARLRKVA